MSLLQRLQRDPFALAAVGYLVYGVVYWLGAFLQMTPERRMESSVPPWVWFTVGGFLVLLVPVILWRPWRGRRIFAGLWALGPLGKGLSLLWRTGRRLQESEPVSVFQVVFALIALTAAALLARAAFFGGRKT
ncbi:MAG: hypothetical protein AAF533_25080 [Acidobacteriota bacterium]